jgi:hypothetical protein
MNIPRSLIVFLALGSLTTFGYHFAPVKYISPQHSKHTPGDYIKEYGLFPYEDPDIDIESGWGWRGCQQFTCLEHDAKCAELLFNLLKEVGRILDSHKIEWMIEGGYLLEMLRDRPYLPEDSDVDMFITAREMKILYDARRKLLDDEGLHFFIDSRHRDGRICFGPNHPLIPPEFARPNDNSRPPFHIDLEPIGYSPIWRTLLLETVKCPFRYRDPDLYPRQFIDFHGELLPIPNKANDLATFIYGPEWKNNTEVWDSGLFPCGKDGGIDLNGDA